MEGILSADSGPRVRKRHLGIVKRTRPIPGSRASGWKRKVNGTVERRT
jgi:hypothetical protein